ncbi:hypothetical protein [Janthinobacterium sp. 17J80-10]|uniref:hypothetical protein n=1 Tax=Janthinobacterium sp. 17J80-10 TaxID=2497863 RepID=UPI001005A030|nr:hypothetical protein [Janthinobacterium sp. 17J80-10]QAU33758.1 hypothetical protein EKL02_05925 [Janthinobacterium sp. 17J80-10]
MNMQCDILASEPLLSAETPAAATPPGEWRYSVGGMLVLSGAFGLLAVLADEALGGAVTQVLEATLGTPGIFSR